MLPKVKFGNAANSSHDGRRNFGRSYGNRTAKSSGGKIVRPDLAGIVFDGDLVAVTGYVLRCNFPDGDLVPVPNLPGLPVETGSQISVKPLQFKVHRVMIYRSVYGSQVQVDFEVPDRVTGNPLMLTYSHAILSNGEKHYLAEQVQVAITLAFNHEVREMVYLGQDRFTEPHPEMQIRVNQST